MPAGRTLLRWILVLCQAGTIAITFPLWQVRVTPPMLPAVELPALSVGWLLLASLVLVLARPRVGLAVHAALLLFACLADQTRLQPQVLSVGLLLMLTLPSESERLVGRAHLVCLWGWAGLHKLASPLWTVGGETGAVPAEDADRLVEVLSFGAGAAELGLAVLALVAAWRGAAAVFGALLHASIFLALVIASWNSAVWFWNVALAAAAWWGLREWEGGAGASLARVSVGARVVAVLFAVLPAGFYLGACDAYLAHVLYTDTTPRAYRFHEGRAERITQLPELGVFLPPEPRLYRAWFRAVSGPGEKLVILDPGRLARARGRRITVLEGGR